MTALEVKLPKSRWSLSVHKFPNSDYFHKIFSTLLQKVLIYVYSKKILPQLLYFWNYNPSPVGQIFSLIDAQADL